MNIMELNEALPGADGSCIMQYLKNYPADFVTEMEITRHADGRTRFLQDKHWAHTTLQQLLDLHLVETDGAGRYRIYSVSPKDGCKRKFLSPQVRFILEHGSRSLDLSAFT